MKERLEEAMGAQVAGRGPDQVATAEARTAAAVGAARAKAGSATVPTRPPRRRFDLSALLGLSGRTFIGLGLLILGFVGYELLGTNLAESRNQGQLRSQLQALPFQADDDVAVSAPNNEPSPPPSPTGRAVANLRIPRVGVDKAVVEGVDLDNLKRGPGHYPGTPLPGQPGNSSIAGHRTTYGSPFYRLDEMQVGDPIFVTTVQGQFRYEVSQVRIVRPDQTEVVEPTSDSRLTLTTCNPRFSDRQRLILVATLKGLAASPVPAAPTPDRTVVEEAPVNPPPEVVGATSDPAAKGPALLWGAACAAIYLLGAWLADRFRRRALGWLIVALPFLGALVVFYEYVARLIPS